LYLGTDSVRIVYTRSRVPVSPKQQRHITNRNGSFSAIYFSKYINDNLQIFVTNYRSESDINLQAFHSEKAGNIWLNCWSLVTVFPFHCLTPFRSGDGNGTKLQSQRDESRNIEK